MGDSIFKHHLDKPVDRLIVAIDIKSTGVYANDDIVGIGGCAITPGGKVVYKFRLGMILRKKSEIRRMNRRRMDWRNLWIKRGYDLSCFDRFWAHRIDKLNTLQDKSYIDLVKTREELAYEINYILSDLEQQCRELIIVTNTTAFDTVQVGRLLADLGLQPLHYSRDGRYRWCYHSTSYLVGLWGGAIDKMKEKHWRAFEDWVKRRIDSIKPYPPIYSRFDPENDALKIALQWRNANRYAEKKMKKRMRHHKRRNAVAA
jgi:hypothetical protein